jgi:hypothetical protein
MGLNKSFHKTDRKQSRFQSICTKGWRLLRCREHRKHALLTLEKTSRWVSTFTRKGLLPWERWTLTVIFLQPYNAASSGPWAWEPVDMGSAQMEHVLCWIIHYTQNNGEFCWGEWETLLEALLQLIISHSSLLWNLTHYHTPRVAQSHRIIACSRWKEIQRILSNAPSFMGREMETQKG